MSEYDEYNDKAVYFFADGQWTVVDTTGIAYYAEDETAARHLTTKLNTLQAQINQLKEALVKAYRYHAAPGICKVLVMHGVDVWAIDRELGRETIYKTGLLRGRAMIEEQSA